MTSVMATSEMDTCADETNDDRILSCCLNLDTSPPASTKDGMKTVYRNSVLLTDDRYTTLALHYNRYVNRIGEISILAKI